MREALRVVAYQFLGYGLQLVFMLLAAKQLGPELQGGYAILRTSTYLIETFMWVGLTSAASYFVARDFERYHGVLVVSAVGYIAAAITVAIPIVVFLLPHLGMSVITGVLIAVWVITLALLQLLMKIFLGQQRYFLYNIVNIVAAVTLYPPFVFLVLTDRVNVDSVVCCNVFGTVVALIIATTAHRGYLRRIRVSMQNLRAAVPEFYAVGLKGYVSTVVFLLLFRADFFLVGYFLPKTLGVYSLAVFVVEAVQKVPDWLGLVLSPKVAAGMDTTGELTRRFVRVSVLFVGAVAACLGALHVFGANYLQFALGSGFAGVEVLVLALMPRAALHVFVAIYGGRLAGHGYTLYHPLAGAVGLVALVIVDGLLLKQVGIMAAIVGITVAYALAASMMKLGSTRVYGRGGSVLQVAEDA